MSPLPSSFCIALPRPAYGAMAPPFVSGPDHMRPWMAFASFRNGIGGWCGALRGAFIDQDQRVSARHSNAIADGALLKGPLCMAGGVILGAVLGLSPLWIRLWRSPRIASPGRWIFLIVCVTVTLIAVILSLMENP